MAPGAYLQAMSRVCNHAAPVFGVPPWAYSLGSGHVAMMWQFLSHGRSAYRTLKPGALANTYHLWYSLRGRYYDVTFRQPGPGHPL